MKTDSAVLYSITNLSVLHCPYNVLCLFRLQVVEGPYNCKHIVTRKRQRTSTVRPGNARAPNSRPIQTTTCAHRTHPTCYVCRTSQYMRSR